MLNYITNCNNFNNFNYSSSVMASVSRHSIEYNTLQFRLMAQKELACLKRSEKSRFTGWNRTYSYHKTSSVDTVQDGICTIVVATTYVRTAAYIAIISIGDGWLKQRLRNVG